MKTSLLLLKSKLFSHLPFSISDCQAYLLLAVKVHDATLQRGSQVTVQEARASGLVLIVLQSKPAGTTMLREEHCCPPQQVRSLLQDSAQNTEGSSILTSSRLTFVASWNYYFENHSILPPLFIEKCGTANSRMSPVTQGTLSAVYCFVVVLQSLNCIHGCVKRSVHQGGAREPLWFSCDCWLRTPSFLQESCRFLSCRNPY